MVKTLVFLVHFWYIDELNVHLMSETIGVSIAGGKQGFDNTVA